MNSLFFQICVNAANTTFDAWRPPAKLMGRIQQGEIPPEWIPVALAYVEPTEWEPKSLETAVHIDEMFWTVEIKIAFDDLFWTDAPVGQTWGWNFARHLGGPENISITWSKTGRSFRNPKRFGDLKFAR